MNSIQENWLTEAVRVLKGKGVIKRDKDIADETGYSKVSISGMLSGNVNISDKFRTKFNSVYSKHLSPQVAEPDIPYGNERINELKYTIEVQKDLIEELKEKVYNLTTQKKIAAPAR